MINAGNCKKLPCWTPDESQDFHAEEGALTIPSALALRRDYQHLKLPVVVMAGAGDKVVFARRAKQLHEAINGSVLHIFCPKRDRLTPVALQDRPPVLLEQKDEV